MMVRKQVAPSEGKAGCDFSKTHLRGSVDGIRWIALISIFGDAEGVASGYHEGRMDASAVVNQGGGAYAKSAAKWIPVIARLYGTKVQLSPIAEAGISEVTIVNEVVEARPQVRMLKEWYSSFDSSSQ